MGWEIPPQKLKAGVLVDIKKELIDSIQIMIDAAIDNRVPDIQFGIVISADDTNNCQIKINGNTHNIKYYGSKPNVNQKYPVFFPKGSSMSSAFIVS